MSRSTVRLRPRGAAAGQVNGSKNMPGRRTKITFREALPKDNRPYLRGGSRLSHRLRRPHSYPGIDRAVSNIRVNVSDLQVGSMALARDYAVCGSGLSWLLTARMGLRPGIALITIRGKAAGPCRDLKGVATAAVVKNTAIEHEVARPTGRGP
jgi:hypothetical protein